MRSRLIIGDSTWAKKSKSTEEPLLLYAILITLHRYTAAYVDYFDSEVTQNGGDWKKVVNDHLYSGSQMLLNGFCGGRMFRSACCLILQN